MSCITQTHRQEPLCSAMHVYMTCLYKSVTINSYHTLSRCVSMLGKMTVMDSSPQLVCLCQHLWLPFLLQRCHCQSATALASPRLHPLHPLSSQQRLHLQNTFPTLGDSSIGTLATILFSAQLASTMLFRADNPPYSCGQVGFSMSPLLLLEKGNRVTTLARYRNSSHAGMTTSS